MEHAASLSDFGFMRDTGRATGRAEETLATRLRMVRA
jgi:hypothetical protein